MSNSRIPDIAFRQKVIRYLGEQDGTMNDFKRIFALF
jgi:hypothetical protein